MASGMRINQEEFGVLAREMTLEEARCCLPCGSRLGQCWQWTSTAEPIDKYGVEQER